MPAPTSGRRAGRGGVVGRLAASALLAAAGTAQAADFSLYLRCAGKVSAAAKSTDAHLEMALRDNNTTALIQKSNLLPVGERLKYAVSPAAYSMVYRAPGPGSAYYSVWYGYYLFSWYPDLRRLQTVRLSIDRQSGDLAGEMLNVEDRPLATFAMHCEPVNDEDLPPPKF